VHHQAPPSNVVKHLLTVLLLLTLAVVFAAPPRLTGIDEAAYKKLIAAQNGKVVLVDFWATWCEPCRAELPKLALLEARLRARGFVLLTVSADDPEQDGAAYAFLLKCGVRLPGYRKQTENDSAFIDSIDTKWTGTLPSLFLYDRNGRKVKSFIGETGTEEIEPEIRKLL
jgi:thiol-disulfide isomerase/thioredoxin